ncbi:MAG TPA: type II secretion system F family protein [Acidimicrobiia bacterium]
MRLLAGVLAGLTVYLAAGMVVGYTPTLRLPQRRRSGRRREWLQQAGVGSSPAGFWLLSAGIGGLVGLGALLATGLAALSAVVGLASALVPLGVLARRRAKRLSEIQEAWPDGLRDLVASVSSGSSVARAIEAMADHGPEPLQRAFDRYQALARALGVAPALEAIREQLGDPTSDRVIEVLIVAHERGGTLVPEILTDLADMTTRDLWTLEQIRSALLEQKLNARIVFVLPWLVLVAITASSDAYRSFYSSSAGMLVVVLAAAASVLGIALVVRLGREPGEPRVLGGREERP